TWVTNERPTDPNALCLLAWAQRLRAERVDAAVKATLEKVDTLGGPTTAEGHFFKGMVLIREMDEAENEFRKAVELRENYAQALLQLGRALNHWMYHNRRHDKFDELKRRLLNACDLQPRQAYPRYLLSLGFRISAEIYEENGDPKSAEEPFTMALRYAREAQKAESNSARGYVAEAEYWETRRDYEKALALRNQSDPFCTKPEARSELYQYRWRLHFWLRQDQAALEDLRVLADMRDDSNPQRVWYRGLFPALVMADQNRRDEALAFLVSTARSQPSSFRAATAAACLLHMCSRGREADALLASQHDRIDFSPRGPAELSGEFMKACYEILSDQRAADTIKDFADSDARLQRLGDAIPSLFQASSRIGASRREEAMRLLKKCDESYDSEDYCYLARAILRKMERDPAWPPWNGQKNDSPGNSSK
ncbi:MAG TPA: hypothetical protein VMV81_07320, partial [Phycisphaerae bacterium]|nr:hypothetical protein [Phycisphaerae bacterium]